MSDLALEPPSEWPAAHTPIYAQHALALALVALATVLAVVVEHLIAAPNLTLIYVLPVIVTATSFGLAPALVAAVAGVLAFDFFFTEPRFSFRIASASDLWAVALLLVIALIVSSLAGEARRRALQAHRAAREAAALQRLAKLVIDGRPRSEILAGAAATLHRIFGAPAVVLAERNGTLEPIASAGGASVTASDQEAARGVLAAGLGAHSGTYPYDRSTFDWWPVESANGFRCVVGLDFSHVERPAAPQRLIDVVRGYLAAAPADR
jgi:K+-sensing histidine kinase KdpD